MGGALALFGIGKKKVAATQAAAAPDASAPKPIISALTSADPRRRKPGSTPSAGRQYGSTTPTILSDKLGS